MKGKTPDNLDITARAVPSKEEIEHLEQERIARRTNPEPREKLLQNTRSYPSGWHVAPRQASRRFQP
jgi:hypothetical protein